MHTTTLDRRVHKVIVPAVLAVIAVLLPVLGITAASTAPAKAATPPQPGAITLKVQAARSVGAAAGLVKKGDAITKYKWIVNQDDTGDPGTASQPLLDKCLPGRAPGGSADPDYADSCPWPATRSTSGFAPIVAQGNQDDLNDNKTLADLPGGKYLISVTAADFKIGGQHFTVDGGTHQVTVDLDPTPLPLSTIRIDVFNDNAPVDGTFEVDAEQGMAGFTAHLTDVFGEVSTDYYGNALCTTYQHKNANGTGPMLFDANNRPIVSSTSTGRCMSDRAGHIIIPNLGPNRLAATVTPPVPAAGQTYQWVQTTTLEGGHDFDIWSQEGATGFDTELVKGGENVASVQFGFVRTRALPVPRTNPPTGEIKGVAVAGLPYVGGQNGQTVPETGFAGANVDGPIKNPWVALSDLDSGDAAVYVGRGAADGSFDLKNVPDGTYQLTLWDDDQDYILWSFNVEVADGGVSDVGNKMLVGWFTHLHGHVFIDSNENGKRDPGEQGVAQFPLTVRERDNSLMDQYTNSSSTDSSGAYDIREAYPLGKWLVQEAFDTRYRTTGVTYQGENETKATTKLGGLVDLDFLPVIGLGGTVDWGVKPYAGAQNGGIAGTVSYDTTRNELDPADAASEGYQPGIPHLKVHLYAPVPCKATTDADKANECRQGKEIVPLQVPDPNDSTKTIDNPDPQRGSMVKGQELSESYTSEEWAAPRGCTARDYQGNPLNDQQALPEFGESANRLCVESPMEGVQMGPSDKTTGNASQTVNGNYAFSTTDVEQFPKSDPRNTSGLEQYAPLPTGTTEDLAPGDYLVGVEIPKNPVGGGDMYKVTSEEDVNVFDGDSYLPQENLTSITPAVAADVPAGDAPAPTAPSQPPSQQAGIISPCAGPLHTVKVTDQPFLDGGGSPFEGQDRPSCSDKIVTVRSGQTTAPNFNLFTDVPIPTHFWGLTINDLGLQLDRRSVQYGEALGLPNVPMGIYDWSGRLLDTTHTDFNGFYEALEPSTDTFNCPVPAGPCPNMYRFTGNDPGSPDHPNADYNSRYRTISTNFQAWPGLYTVTDTAPTQVATTALTPGSTQLNPAQCDLGDSWPQLLAVDRPYVRQNTRLDDRVVTVTGRSFGSTTGVLKLGSTTVTPTTWNDTTIKFTVPSSVALGAQPIAITRAGAGGLKSVNTLTLQVLDAASTANSATNPKLAEVGPGKAYATVQSALEAARPTSATKFWMVVVWPGTATDLNPHGEYNENVIVHHRVRIQGVGPGGFAADGTFVPGSIIDGSGFNPDNAQGQSWLQRLGTLTYSGNPEVPDAAVMTVLDDPTNGSAPASYPVTVDGLRITGGTQSDFPANVNEVTGGFKTPYGVDGALVTQGGGIYVHSHVQNMSVTDNVIEGNGGSYGGGVRVGTPYRTDNANTGFTLARNQVRDNGGTNLAGGIGIFAGSTGYSVADNAICGNFSAEYGGAISAFGYQSSGLGTANGGTISGNRIWFNSSYDEGGAVMVAGELPANPANLSEGTGPVTIDKNVISENLANDDGGGIRILQASGSHVSRTTPGTVTITNNTVTENVSTHEGGGIALDDAAFVNIVGNTVAKNLTTASAVTSDGLPAPAGLSTAQNSDQLQARLKNGFLFPGTQTLATTTFSKPTVLDDVFSDNRAGSFSGGWITGIGGTLPDGTPNDVNHWDMGLSDGPGALSPVGTVLQTADGTDVDPTDPKVTDTPGFKDPSTVSVDVLASRTYPAFRQSLIIGELLPPNLSSDYHLTGKDAAAYSKGVASTGVTWGTGPVGWKYTVSAPADDIDGQVRPTGTGKAARYDAGSDQVTP